MYTGAQRFNSGPSGFSNLYVLDYASRQQQADDPSASVEPVLLGLPHQGDWSNWVCGQAV